MGSKKYNVESFVEKVSEKFSDKYSFDKTVYISYDKPVIITCKKHNYDFEIKPNRLLWNKNKNMSVGFCPKCLEDYFYNVKIKVINGQRKIWNNKFDYDVDSYVNLETPFTAICKKHGPFKVKINSSKGKEKRKHRNCPECAKEERANKFPNIIMRNNKYYFNCNIHGEVEIGKNRYEDKEKRKSCPTCNIEKQRKFQRTTKQKIIVDDFGNDYLIFFHNEKELVEFRCKKHNTVSIVPFKDVASKKSKKGKKHHCDLCRNESMGRLGNEKFELVNLRREAEQRIIDIIKHQYSKIYDFVEFEYIGTQKRVWVYNKILQKKECKNRQSFVRKQTLTTNPNKVKTTLKSKNRLSYEEAKERVQKLRIKTFREYKHWRKHYNITDMPAHPNRTYIKEGFTTYFDFFGTDESDYMSMGEKRILEHLKNRNIRYETQKTFPGCKYRSYLKFDFYLPDYNLIIEFDGTQHEEDGDYPEKWGGIEGHLKLQKSDKIKNEYCKKNNIHLSRINYTYLVENYLEWYVDYLISTAFEKNGFEYYVFENESVFKK